MWIDFKRKAKSFVASRFTGIQTYVGRFVASGWRQCGGFRRYTAGAAFWGFLANPCFGRFLFWFSVSSPFHPKFVQMMFFLLAPFCGCGIPPEKRIKTLNSGNFWRGVFCWGFFQRFMTPKLHHESITCRPCRLGDFVCPCACEGSWWPWRRPVWYGRRRGWCCNGGTVVGTSTSREGISGVIEH